VADSAPSRPTPPSSRRRSPPSPPPPFRPPLPSPVTDSVLMPLLLLLVVLRCDPSKLRSIIAMASRRGLEVYENVASIRVGAGRFVRRKMQR